MTTPRYLPYRGVSCSMGCSLQSDLRDITLARLQRLAELVDAGHSEYPETDDDMGVG